jgi:hypothetical protein
VFGRKNLLTGCNGGPRCKLVDSLSRRITNAPDSLRRCVIICCDKRLCAGSVHLQALIRAPDRMCSPHPCIHMHHWAIPDLVSPFPSSDPLQLCTHWRGQGSCVATDRESCESAQLSQSACFAGVRALGRARSRDMQAVTHSCKLVRMVARVKVLSLRSVATRLAQSYIYEATKSWHLVHLKTQTHLLARGANCAWHLTHCRASAGDDPFGARVASICGHAHAGAIGHVPDVLLPEK